MQVTCCISEYTGKNNNCKDGYCYQQSDKIRGQAVDHGSKQ